MLKYQILRVINSPFISRFFNKYTRNMTPVFMMHRFIDSSTGNNNPDDISADLLDSYLKYLVENEYNVLSIKDVIKKAKLGQSLYKTVSFTIDDGYLDFKNIAYPVFKKYNLPASVFITTDFIEGKIMMWWDTIEYIINNTPFSKFSYQLNDKVSEFLLGTENDKRNAINKITNDLKLYHPSKVLHLTKNLAKELKVSIPQKPPLQYSACNWADLNEMKKYKISFEPHTVSHPILSRITAKEQEWQIETCIAELNKNLGVTSEVFCYPNGLDDDFTKETEGIVKRLNLSGACSAEPGFVSSDPKQNIFSFKRIAIPNDFIYFNQYVSGFGALKTRLGWVNAKKIEDNANYP